MRTLLVCIYLGGIFLSVESACDANVCTPPTASTQCSAYEEYINCLEDEKKVCTDTDSAIEDSIKSLIEATQAVLAALDCSTSTCNAATCVPASVTSCSAYKTYLDCLGEEKKKCTDKDTVYADQITAAISTAEAALNALQCSTGGCDAATCRITSVTSCTAYNTYLDCLDEEKKKCTGEDIVNSGLITAAITTAEAERNALQCSSSGCDVDACELTVSSCSTYKIYIDCLDDEQKKCTQDDTINSGLITTAMANAEVERNGLQCSGVMVKLSVSTLILSLLGFYV